MTSRGSCLEQRVLVLGEKPMAANLEEARDLVQIVRTNFDAVRRKPEPALQHAAWPLSRASSSNVSGALVN